jgi:hypothetical protein
MLRENAIKNIKTINFSHKNENGHKVYEFYPNRKFSSEIVICPWFGEVKNHMMLPAIFAICDQSNIKLLALSTEDNIPIFSLYSHGVISVSDEEVKMDSGWQESIEKIKYFEPHSEDCYSSHYKKYKGERGWDFHWGKYSQELDIKHFLLSCIPKIEHINIFLDALSEYQSSQTIQNLLNQLNRFEKDFVTRFYQNHLKSYNMYFLENQIKSYEALVNDLNIDDSPKIFAYIKNHKHQSRRALEAGKCYFLDEGACRRRAGIEYILSDIMGEALIEVDEEAGPNKIYNFNVEYFKNEYGIIWPFQTYITLRDKLNSKFKNSLTSIQILLSLNNNFSYVSQAGVSSILYFEPVNILYAEHQHWATQIGEEFRKRPQQELFNNPAVYDANDYSEIDKLIDKNDSNEKVFKKTKEYINERRNKDYFKSLFLNYLNEK